MAPRTGVKPLCSSSVKGPVVSLGIRLFMLALLVPRTGILYTNEDNLQRAQVYGPDIFLGAGLWGGAKAKTLWSAGLDRGLNLRSASRAWALIRTPAASWEHTYLMAMAAPWQKTFMPPAKECLKVLGKHVQAFSRARAFSQMSPIKAGNGTAINAGPWKVVEGEV